MNFTDAKSQVITIPVKPRVLGYSMLNNVNSGTKCGSCGK